MSNLDVAGTAQALLSAHGTVELAYLTAEFEPFSSSQRPDVLFLPATGPNAGRWFVVELRVDPSARGRLPSVMALIEHRRFLQEDMSGAYLFFAVATHLSNLNDEDRAQLAVAGVEVLMTIDSGRALADAILAWASSARIPPWAAEEH